jgi:hypothetical protein
VEREARSPWWINDWGQALKGWNNNDYGAPSGLVQGAGNLPGASRFALHPWLFYHRAFGAQFDAIARWGFNLALAFEVEWSLKKLADRSVSIVNSPPVGNLTLQKH